MTEVNEYSPLAKSTQEQKTSAMGDNDVEAQQQNSATESTNDNKEEEDDGNIPESTAWTLAIIFIIVSGLIAWATELYYEALVAFGVNWLVFLCHAWPFHSEKFYDFTGMITYISVTLYSFFSSKGLTYPSIRSIILSTMVLIWTLSLGNIFKSFTKSIFRHKKEKN